MGTAAIQRNQITAYQQPVDEVLAALGTDARRGLSEAEAQLGSNDMAGTS